MLYVFRLFWRNFNVLVNGRQRRLAINVLAKFRVLRMYVGLLETKTKKAARSYIYLSFCFSYMYSLLVVLSVLWFTTLHAPRFWALNLPPIPVDYVISHLWHSSVVSFGTNRRILVIPSAIKYWYSTSVKWGKDSSKYEYNNGNVISGGTHYANPPRFYKGAPAFVGRIHLLKKR